MPKRNLILLADDDAAMRQMLAATLRRDGFCVAECADGAALLGRLQAARDTGVVPGLVVSDLQMPGATGFDVLHWLSRCLRDVPVILITAFGDTRTHERAAKLGAAEVMDKPFDLEALRSRVRAILSLRESAGPT